MAEAVQGQRQLPSVVPAQVPAHLTDLYQIDEAKWFALKNQIFPDAKDVNVIELALSLCKVNNYDVFKKPYHIVSVKKDGKMVEQIWPSIGSLSITAHRTGLYAGKEKAKFGPDIKYSGMDVPSSAEVTVFRRVDGEDKPFTAEVFFKEKVSTDYNGNPTFIWKKSPRQQLGKCALAAALREAFPEELGGTYCSEEMDGQELSEDATIPSMVNQSVSEKRQRRTPPTSTAGKSSTQVSIEIKEEIKQDRINIAQSQLEVANQANDEAAAQAAQKALDELKGISAAQSVEINRTASDNGWTTKEAIDHIVKECGVPEGKRSQWMKFVTDEKRVELLDFFKNNPQVKDVEEANDSGETSGTP